MKRLFNFSRQNRRTSIESTEDKNIYDTLSPTLLKEENIQTYISAIDEALRDSRNKNIAITGAYGSGKSSILKTYQSLNQDEKFLNISLANFKVDKLDDEDSTPENYEENNLNRLLELSILQQIFYHVKKSEIPDSRFKRINSLSQNSIIGFVLIILIWLVSYAVLFHFPLIQGWFPEVVYSTALKIISAIFFLGGIGIGLGKLRRVFNNSKINKFNIQSGDFEIDKDIDRSIINKHLDEIIYFFHVTDYRIVVIEDLDRFNNTEIFSKLREINLLLNNSEQIAKSKKPIVFIYAIRDDMFVDRDRVKFFDFIVPIIPIINPSNSSEILLRKLETLKDNRKPSKSLVQGISYFIDDMRLLKNIWNEYLTYRDILKESLSQDKLFSIITYKNFYPDDFVALHTNESNISKIFEKRMKFETKLFTQLNNEIKLLQVDLKELERHRLKDAAELRKIYISTINELFPQTIAFVINHKVYDLNSLNDKESFNTLKTENRVVRIYYDHLRLRNQGGNSYYSNVTSQQINFNFEKLEEKVNDKISFENRLKLVDKDYSYKDQIISDIATLQEKKKVIKNYDLRQLLTELDSEEILEEYNSNKLLVYIITNGYVDKYYAEYISYFHGVSLSSTDHDFLIALRSGIAFDFNFELKNIGNLAAKIESKYFQTRPILNYHLFDYWFSNNKYNTQQLAIISLLSTEFKDRTDFIKGIIEYSNEVDNFSRVSITEWNGFWKHLEENNTYTNDIIERYFKAIIVRGNLTDIVQQSKNSSLKKHIENKDRFLSLFPEAEHFEKIEEVIDELEIEFEHIALVKNDLMGFIYDRNRYKINQHNLKTIMGYKDENESLSYLDISNSSLKILKENIDVQIDEFVQNVLLDANQLTNEPVKGFINLLNHSGLSEDLKKFIIEKFDKTIPDLDQIEDIEILDLLIANNKITPTWPNVLLYFNKYEGIINPTLITFLGIKEVYTVLTKSKLRETISDKSERSKLVRELLLNDDLNLEAYAHLLSPTHFIFSEINIDNISEDKAHWVIQNKYAKATESNFHYLKENFPGEHIHLAEVQSKDFLSDIEVYELDDNDILSLLKSNKLSLKEKLTVFQNQVNYSLISRTPGIAEVVSQILVDAKSKTNYEILNSLFAETKSIELRVKLLNINFEELSDSETYGLIRQMPKPYKRIAVNFKRPLLFISDYNRVLAENLKRSNLISSFSENKKGIRIIAKYSD